MLAVVHGTVKSSGTHFGGNATSQSRLPIPPHVASFIHFNLLFNLSIQTSRSTFQLILSPIVFHCPFCRHTGTCFDICVILLPHFSTGHNYFFCAKQSKSLAFLSLHTLPPSFASISFLILASKPKGPLLNSTESFSNCIHLSLLQALCHMLRNLCNSPPTHLCWA
jgi:hypothetical protein